MLRSGQSQQRISRQMPHNNPRVETRNQSGSGSYLELEVGMSSQHPQAESATHDTSNTQTQASRNRVVDSAGYLVPMEATRESRYEDDPRYV